MSVIYLAEIKQLIELQKVDDERFATRQILENAPEEIAQLRKKYESVERRRDHILDKITHLNEQSKRLSSELSDDSAKIKKSKTKLMQAENTREYQAMVREVDNMEKSSSTREEEKTALEDELKNQNVLLTEIDKEYTALKSELEVKEGGLAEKIEKTEALLTTLDARRAESSKSISTPVFQRYEFIRKRLDHPVIVAIKDGVCTGCHIAVPPQVFIELQRGQQIMSCPNCQRLIFWDKHFEEEDTPVAAPENAEEQTETTENTVDKAEKNDSTKRRVKKARTEDEKGQDAETDAADTNASEEAAGADSEEA
ncbi:MAG: hypothetical protein K5657_00625 [Desulfovibrio sp.]|nr:hypothetical protein [Desulfovibrio sp.]